MSQLNTWELHETAKINVRELKLTDKQFALLCQENPELRLELTAQGELLIMPPAGSITGWRNNELAYAITDWAKKEGSGVAFDSSTGFTLPNGAKRSPDFSWVRRERWEALTREQQEGLAPLCPDFVVELRSRTDRLATLQAKMQEYLDNGARLGWLIDPSEKRVYIYRPGRTVEELADPVTLSGEQVLPGFVLHVAQLW
jgi:Uma2 family endonuclease